MPEPRGLKLDDPNVKELAFEEDDSGGVDVINTIYEGVDMGYWARNDQGELYFFMKVPFEIVNQSSPS